ncbi:MAG: ABC transporter permease [Thermovirgaceae bacterium]|jgi:tungstate transport system permease protein|nr:ABC transporter permease [Synergistales bacterium]MDI9392163.1 ABC transporter permease [Synergistota bacterium]MDY0178386.1 ABC transporter permease [Synergistaceae bacterium]HRW87701.1 ABC transporter permease [Thermovirgaceae bacterium]MDD3133602.1 ABC transporter permease [Synergistales bacterium]
MGYLAEGFRKAFIILFSGQEETFSAIFTTLKVSTFSIIVTLAVGIPLGFMLGYYTFPGKHAFRAVSDTLMAIPTVVVGLLVYAFISRSGPFGSFGLLFTLRGVAIGQFVLGLPVVVSLTASATEQMEDSVKMTLMTLGASPGQLAASSLWEGRYAVIAAAMTAYSRIISEVGVSMMIGGNIKWRTRTITTAIALETGKGQFAEGIALGIVLLAIAFAVNGFVSVARRRASI